MAKAKPTKTVRAWGLLATGDGELLGTLAPHSWTKYQSLKYLKRYYSGPYRMVRVAITTTYTPPAKPRKR